jgi:hypothetical protein
MDAIVAAVMHLGVSKELPMIKFFQNWSSLLAGAP